MFMESLLGPFEVDTVASCQNCESTKEIFWMSQRLTLISFVDLLFLSDWLSKQSEDTSPHPFEAIWFIQPGRRGGAEVDSSENE